MKNINEKSWSGDAEFVDLHNEQFARKLYGKSYAQLTPEEMDRVNKWTARQMNPGPRDPRAAVERAIESIELNRTMKNINEKSWSGDAEFVDLHNEQFARKLYGKSYAQLTPEEMDRVNKWTARQMNPGPRDPRAAVEHPPGSPGYVDHQKVGRPHYRNPNMDDRAIEHPPGSPGYVDYRRRIESIELNRTMKQNINDSIEKVSKGLGRMTVQEAVEEILGDFVSVGDTVALVDEDTINGGYAGAKGKVKKCDKNSAWADVELENGTVVQCQRSLLIPVKS